jgi:signal transduction histidine kinase
MQQEFINIAAHELRTPIQAITGYIELLQDSPDFDQKDSNKIGNDTYEFVNSIIRNANRLKQLTKDILDVTRIEAGSLNLNKQDINLTEKIQNVIKDIKITNKDVKNKDLSIEFNDSTIVSKNKTDSDSSYISIQADKDIIYQVLTNLLNNAIKFSDKKGKITIALENDDIVDGNKKVIVRVKDEGKGIDSEVKSQLFNKFATKSLSQNYLSIDNDTT